MKADNDNKLPRNLPPRGLSRTESDGVVYVVGFETYVKFGYTTNFHKRYMQLQTGLPDYLYTLATFPGTELDEAALMSKFARNRTMYGEWFRYDGELADWINAGLPQKTFREAINEYIERYGAAA